MSLITDSHDVRDCDCCEQGKHVTCRDEVWDDDAHGRNLGDWVECPCKAANHKAAS